MKECAPANHSVLALHLVGRPQRQFLAEEHHGERRDRVRVLCDTVKTGDGVLEGRKVATDKLHLNSVGFTW